MAVLEKHNDTHARRAQRDVTATHANDLELELPADLPGENDMTRALFHDADSDTALELFREDQVIYLLPWCARNGGVAGFTQDVETFATRPVEFTADRVREVLTEHAGRYVDLLETPAWVLDDRGTDDVQVTWHARCRWADRVEPMTDPAPAIRKAYHEGVPVGVDRGCGRYYPPADIVVTYIRTDPPTVTTVLPADDLEQFETSHLKECASCSELYDPGDIQGCPCCQGGVCNWCKNALEPVA